MSQTPIANPVNWLMPSLPIQKPVAEAVGGKLNELATPESPGAPQGIAAPPSPTSEDPEAARKAQEAMDSAALSERKARGRASTILTGGKGVLGSATTSRRTLLGS